MVYTNETVAFYRGDPWAAPGLDANGNRDDLPQLEILTPTEMLQDHDLKNHINVSAPMVRYSKLPARMLFASYNTHITYAPMILAREFVRSAKARDADFTTSTHERGIFNFPLPTASGSGLGRESASASAPARDPARALGHMSARLNAHAEDLENEEAQPGTYRRVRGALIAQFAARSAKEFADAVEVVSPYVDGVDLNCGCPQPWAYKDEIGSYLLRQPELVRDMVKAARARTSSSYPISIKIRLDKDPKLTSQLIQNAIQAGISYIGVHGRTRWQRDTEPVNLPGIRFAVEEARGAVSMIANGDCFRYSDSERARLETGANAVMSARGLLENPALFAGYEKTPLEAIERFLDISTSTSLIFPLFHRHVSYMLEHLFVNKAERTFFNSLISHAAVMDWLDEFLERRRRGDRTPVIPAVQETALDGAEVPVPMSL